MDHALWLLLVLRLKGWLRRIKRAQSTVKGLLVTILGGLCMTSWLASLVVFVPAPEAAHLERVRELGPLLLLLFCLLNYFLAAGERVLAFSPAEVNLLFPAPFTRRRLLLYKIAGLSAGSILLGLFLTLCLRQHTSGLVTGLVGVTLTTLFLQYFSLAIALVVSIIGARAYDRQRRLMLAVLVVAAGALVWSQGAGQFDRPLSDLAADIRHHPAVEVLLAPFIWQVNAVSADNVWPDLVLWGGLCLVADLALLGLLLALDAHYLEAAAAAGEKIYRRLERLRRGGLAGVSVSSAEKARWSLPMLPRWGGIGPLAWRQLLAALRNYWWMVTVAIFLVAFTTPMFVLSRQERAHQPAALLGVFGAMSFFVALFLPALLAFDFRADVDRMDVLKTLPLPAWKLVAGQLLVPVLLVTLAQMMMLAALQAALALFEPALWALTPFLVSVNFLAFAVENLFFLVFPTRQLAATPGDMQNFGRVLVIWLAKVTLLTVILTVAGLAGLGAYLVTGPSLIAAGLVAWLVVTGCAVAAVPLLCLAFNRYDVARDTPP